MKTTAKKSAKRAAQKPAPAAHKQARIASVAATIRRIGSDWALHWNAGDLDKVVATYSADAVYLPSHHQAVHGREAIREYLRGPLSRGATDLAFDVTYIKQHGGVSWDVGTYRMSVPQADGTNKEDRGKYLTVWKRVGTRWLIAADAWSSDLPLSH
ncbi:MAG TPA: DUF4440 domain-containing protein [Terriglobales bacterium]